MVKDYHIPNTNQCKQCHTLGGRMIPIGIRARHLNRSFPYPEGEENQIAHWTRKGLLDGAPSSEQAPRLADYDDETSGSLDERARAWLEMNCAHCHTEGAPAWNTGLDLMASVTDSSLFGVYKSPTAAGRGTGMTSSLETRTPRLSCIGLRRWNRMSRCPSSDARSFTRRVSTSCIDGSRGCRRRMKPGNSQEEARVQAEAKETNLL